MERKTQCGNSRSCVSQKRGSLSPAASEKMLGTRSNLRSFLMRFGHLFHASKQEVVFRPRWWWMRSAVPFLRMAAVNPGGGESGVVGREVIVKETFRGVQNLAFLVPRITKLFDHVGKVARIRFI